MHKLIKIPYSPLGASVWNKSKKVEWRLGFWMYYSQSYSDLIVIPQ